VCVSVSYNRFDDVNNTYTLFSLEGVHVDAYRAFQMSRDLEAVIHRFLPDSEEKPSDTSGSPSSRNKVAISLMTPVLPMLVDTIKSSFISSVI